MSLFSQALALTVEDAVARVRPGALVLLAVGYGRRATLLVALVLLVPCYQL
jgi:hypothetical protein